MAIRNNAFLDPRSLGLPSPSFGGGGGIQLFDRRVNLLVDPLAGAGGGQVNEISVGELVDAGLGECDRIPDAKLRSLCKGVKTGWDLGSGIWDKVTGSGDQRGASYNPMAQCPTGTVPDGKGGCKVAGVGGTLQRMLPGGATGYAWSPVLGIWGAGLEPFVVESMTRRCPKGHVLGNDGVCYRRGQVSKQNRAWNPGTKPLLTGGDVAALSKAKRLQKTIRRLASAHGPRKPCRCGIKKGKAVKV